MGFLLKEVLKALCGRNQWSYAVFWKIGCHNPKLLIWEDCYYESFRCQFPPRVAGMETSNLPFGNGEGSWLSSDFQSSQLGTREEDILCSLINKMMVNNSVNIVGEGIIGRAAFTGDHQWIPLNNFTRDGYPPEVYNEVVHQFSAGIQTIAVIPVLPHGVIQFGSFFTIMENMGFVNDVKSFTLQLGCVPGALLSEDYSAKASIERLDAPVTIGGSVSVNSPAITSNSTPPVTYAFNQQINSPHTLRPVQQFHPLGGEINNHNSVLTHQTTDMTWILSNYHDTFCQPQVMPMVNPSFDGQPENLAVEADLHSNLDSGLQHSASLNARSAFNDLIDLCQSGLGDCSIKFMKQQNFSGCGSQKHANPNINASSTSNLSHLKINEGHVFDHSHSSVRDSLPGGLPIQGVMSRLLKPNMTTSSVSNPPKVATADLCGTSKARTRLQHDDLTKGEGYSLPNLTSQSEPGTIPTPLEGSNKKNVLVNVKGARDKLAPADQMMDNDLLQDRALKILSLPLEKHVSMGDHIPACNPPSSSDDLFDILGVDLKNKLLNGNWSKLLAEESDASGEIVDKKGTCLNMQDIDPGGYSTNEAMSDSGVFYQRGTDHLLDAVVSRAKSLGKLDSDDVSCRTTVTRITNTSVPSPVYRKVMSDHVQGGLFGFPKEGGKAVPAETSSLRSGCSRDDARNCSQTTSIYGSQLSSWVENASKVKCENSVSTGYSKRPNEGCKSNRKRLKPGENPRPRPKDRQMIQDRVKELREIVPNGAKCSIDALLERTIKHMLFLQSVTKHADKLKQTGESKIISKKGGLLLKDNFEGGATWAYEVGSQPMVCPIIVEDLNPPRQMLVEMLCEERGFFLEIADLIRGLGLTILKGVMETRNDQIWACFAVEANRDITRMEIFMSLVRLLEQTGKGSTSSANAIYHTFPQATQIAATGRPSSLQ